MLTREEIFYVWVDSFVGLEYKNKFFLSELAEKYDYQDMENVIKAEREKIVCAIGENAFNTISVSCTNDYVRHILNELAVRNITPITCRSKDYPEWLLNYNIPPFVLYAKGDVHLLKTEMFSIVGSRRSTAHSLKIAEEYAKALSDAGVTLVTGIAQGVDTAVLRAGLLNGGKVISVVAGGFDHIYPSENANLVDEIAEKGLVLSEHVPSIESMPFMFPTRNRIIAGLSSGVLVVSGRKRSGTMYTAGYAVEYSKDLFAVPYSIGVESGEGCNELIKRGALLTDTPDDILNHYDKEVKKEESALTDEEQEVYEFLRNGSKHIEEICANLKKQIFEIKSTISALEIKGLITRVGANVYVAAK